MRRRRRPTLHHAVKDKRVTVLGPVKQPEMDFMSHTGGPSSLRGGEGGQVNQRMWSQQSPPHCVDLGFRCIVAHYSLWNARGWTECIDC